MRHRKRRRAVEAVKDMVIVLLALSAVYLALRSQLAANLPGGTVAGWAASLFQWEAETETEEQTVQTVELRPLRMAVNLREEGRHGVQYDQAAVDALYAETAGLLRDCLDSAGPPEPVSEQAWRAALSRQTGVYFDFQGQVPLAVLRAALSLEGSGSIPENARARRLLLAEDAGGAVLLYYNNASDGSFYACSTSEALRGHLQSTLSAYGSNGAVFAFEGEDQSLFPYVLITSPAAAKVFSAVNPVAGMTEGRERLLESLGFHPQSSVSSRSGDSLVVSEWPDRFTISDGGRAVYETAAGEAPKYPVGGASGPTAAEVVQATQLLAWSALGPWQGDARLYLIGVEQLSDGGWQADYGYCLNGIPVELGDEGYAARFEVRGGQVTAFTLQLRTYTDTGIQSILLPEAQAAAAMGALDAAGGELRLAYEDSGAAEQLEAGWIVSK